MELQDIPSDILNCAAAAVEAMPQRAPFKGDVLEAIAKAIVADRQRSQWRDISTAPKNTKLIAGYFNENGKWRTVTACYHTELPWSDEYGDHEEEYAPEGWYEECESSEVIYPTVRTPAFWMSLPAPPKQD